MQQPEARDFAGGEIAARAARIAAHGGALFVQDFDYLLQQLEQPGTGADLYHGRHESGIVGEAAGAVAHHAGHRDGHQVARRLGVEQEVQILAAQLHAALIHAGDFIVQDSGLRGVAGIALDLRAERAVQAIGPQRGNAEQHNHGVAGGRNQVGDGSRLRQVVALRHVERQTIGQDAARVQQRNRAVIKRVGVQLQARQPVRSKPERRGGKLDRVFEVAALHLEVVWPQVHTFRPDHSRKQLHKPVRYFSIAACAGLQAAKVA